MKDIEIDETGIVPFTRYDAWYRKIVANRNLFVNESYENELKFNRPHCHVIEVQKGSPLCSMKMSRLRRMKDTSLKLKIDLGQEKSSSV
jgi:hypothetical protein